MPQNPPKQNLRVNFGAVHSRQSLQVLASPQPLRKHASSTRMKGGWSFVGVVLYLQLLNGLMAAPYGEKLEHESFPWHGGHQS